MPIGTSPLSEKIAASKDAIREAIAKYTGGEGVQGVLPGISLSFNGGKDCTVLLALILQVINESQTAERPKRLHALYIATPPVFEEMETFIHERTERCNLYLTCITGDIKAAFVEYAKSHTNIKAIMMGTRRTDPYAQHLQTFAHCDVDQGWPNITRVNPMLDWNYDDIWTYIRQHNVPYCPLYDQGYTSLGSTIFTIPNPKLGYNENGLLKYHPAWKLEDEAYEREGRLKTPRIVTA